MSARQVKITRRFRSLLVKRIAAERSISETTIQIVAVTAFAKNEWGHVGTIEICYNTAGHRALYGFTSLARVSCYMD